MKPSSASGDRRLFLKASLASALGGPSITRGQAVPNAAGWFQEAARDLPVNTDADVIVCGAGPAGVTAAITAARAGAKVRLFEAHGSLGGVWTSSLLGYLLDIPLRALIARDVDGLMMAGRCISGDFIAHASYRVTGNAVAMGEAAGATAAVAAKSKTAPHDVPWRAVQPVIEKVRDQG
jgi:succinate dehydrogenase/fumarate reductase flavoprotein subunit